MADIVEQLLMKPVPDADGLLSEILREDAANEILRLRSLHRPANMQAADQIIRDLTIKTIRCYNDGWHDALMAAVKLLKKWPHNEYVPISGNLQNAILDIPNPNRDP